MSHSENLALSCEVLEAVRKPFFARLLIISILLCVAASLGCFACECDKYWCREGVLLQASSFCISIYCSSPAADCTGPKRIQIQAVSLTRPIHPLSQEATIGRGACGAGAFAISSGSCLFTKVGNFEKAGGDRLADDKQNRARSQNGRRTRDGG